MNLFSFVQWNKYFHEVKDEMFHLTQLRLVEWTSPHENIYTITLINIHYLYTIPALEKQVHLKIEVNSYLETNQSALLQMDYCC